MTIIKNAVVNAGGNPIMLQGLLVNQPNYGVIGRLYIATDTLVIYRDTGTSWAILGAVSSIPNLDQVLTVGNSSTKGISLNVPFNTPFQIDMALFGTNYHFEIRNGVLLLQNLNSLSAVSIQSTGLSFFNGAASYNFTFQSLSGTLALLSNLPKFGTYIPTLTPQNNCTSVTLISAVYSNINNLLNVNIVMDVKPTVGGLTTGVQGITLPNTFTTYTIYQAIGVAFDVTTSAVVAASGVRSATGNSIIGFLPVTNNVQRVSINISFMGTP